jgi:autotransporter-associated beta strand protein
VDLTASAIELGTQRITNNAILEFSAVSSSQTLSGPLDGTGQLVVSAGTLTLSSSQSDWTGNVVLTNGGVLVVGGTQNVGGTGPLGINSTIFFNGGTLQFSVANTFDYSPNFSTAANQAYSFNSGGQNVTFTNALTSSGGTLTKLGSGSLTLAGANTYNGATTVSAGKLVIQGSQGSGSITVANSAALGVNQGGQQITPGTLTVGTSAGATLEFNNVNSTTTAAIVAGTLAAGGTITVNINSGTFLQGTSYPLLQWTSGTFTAGSFALGTVTGAGGNLTVSGNTLYLNVTALASTWTGNVDAIWSTTSGTLDWKAGGSPSQWIDGAPALFDDTVTTANTNITLGSTVVPNGVTVNNSSKPYTITSISGNVISGSTGLTKAGNGTLTLAGGVNTYTGATIISGGTLSVGILANAGTASDIGSAGNSAANLVLNGGTLQLNATVGGAASDHLFTLGTANGAIDDESGSSLTLNNPGLIVMNGAGARTLTLTGNGSDELDATISDNGGATSLAKSGSGIWVLAGNNTNSGTVTISAGTLQVGNGGASGSVGSGNIVDNGTLDFNTSSTLTNGTVTGIGAVTVDGGGKIILPGNNTYAGATTINTGTLQVGNGGASGALNNANAIADNDTFIFNSTSTLTLNPAITGSGNVIVHKGTLQAIGNNSYTGWTEIDTGATFQACSGPVGGLASSVVTNNGTLLLVRQDNGVFIIQGDIVGSGSVMKACNNGNSGDVTLLGNNTYTGGTYIIGGSIIFGDNSTPGAGSFVGNVFLTNDYAHNTFGTVPNDFVPATLVFNRPDDFIFPGNIVGEGFVTLNGSGMVTLTGNNTYTNRGTGATTTISSGTLQVGNGGTSGSIGDDSVVDNTVLIWNRSDTITYDGDITGSGSFVQFGSGSLTLTSTNLSYTGDTTVSNGTLVVSGGSLASYVFVEGGTLVPASLSTGGTLDIPNGYLIMDSGTVLVPLNRSLTGQTNIVAYDISYNGGTLVVTNVGSPLVVGDKFYLFSQPVSVPSVSGAGATWQNDLAVDGSITAMTVPAVVNTNPPVMQISVSGNTLALAWPTNLGWILQTNSVGLIAGSQWFSYPGSAAITNVNITINPTITNVFFRMVYTNTP